MYTRDTVIQNQTGMHARPASLFIENAKKFDSKITIENLDDEQGGAVNAKSIMMLLTLGLSCGSKVRISATGSDETEAVNTLVELIEKLQD